LDVHILVDGGKSLQEVHDLTEKIENKIEQIIPDVDVTVHPEPQAFN
jgi:divalent metal cation (Fe/Co/Zn/Cd) transporter